MKIRTGFVSNSSSSSFIIGAAKVLDEKKLKDYLEFLPQIYSGEELSELANKDRWGDYSLNGKTFTIMAPVNDDIGVSFQIEKNTTYFVFRCGHNEGDGVFYNDDDFDLDYSIVDEEYFKENYPKSHKALKALQGINGVTKTVKYDYGAARNG